MLQSRYSLRFAEDSKTCGRKQSNFAVRYCDHCKWRFHLYAKISLLNKDADYINSLHTTTTKNIWSKTSLWYSMNFWPVFIVLYQLEGINKAVIWLQYLTTAIALDPLIKNGDVCGGVFLCKSKSSHASCIIILSDSIQKKYLYLWICLEPIRL